MTRLKPDNLTSDPRFEEACARFLDEDDSPTSVDKLLAEYSDLGPSLLQFIDDTRELRQMAAGFAPHQSTTDGHSSATQVQQRLPIHLGPYRIERWLGSGAMSWVFEARHEGLDCVHALKVYKRTDLEQQARLRREAQTMARLSGDGVCPVHAVESIDGLLYIAMELVEGESLEQVCRRGPMPWQQAVDLTARIADILHRVHGRGVIHRDVKPSNILIRDNGDVVLTDFGLALSLNVDDRLTADDAVIGTPSYMSPEQADGRRDDLTAATDQFSLGCVLYELLTGDVPFEGDSTLDLLKCIRLNQPQPPGELREEIPPAVEAACLKALAKNPADRFPSLDEFATALRHPDQPTSTRPLSRNRFGKALLLACCIVLIIVVIVKRGESPSDSPTAGAAKPSDKSDSPPATKLEQPQTQGSELQRDGGIDLTEGLSRGEVTPKGRWSRDGTTILIEPGSQPQGVTLTQTSPVEYDFTFTVVRREQPKPGMRGLVLFLRLPGDRFTRLFVDNPDYSQFFGNKPNALILSGKILGRVLPLNEPVPVRCEIRADRATCYVSDRPVIEYRGNFSQFPHKDDGGIGSPVLLVGSLGEKFEIREPQLFTKSD